MLFLRRLLPGLAALMICAGAGAGSAVAQTGDQIRARLDARPHGAMLFVGTSIADGYLRQLVVEPWRGSYGDDTLAGGAYSYHLLRFARFFTLSAELGGAYRFGETQGGQFWATLFLRYDGFPWTEYLYTTFGLSMGPDYVTRLPQSERGTILRPERNQSRFLNNFSPEISVALPSAPEHQLVFRYIHRSGVFGSFNGVYEGANAAILGYRFRF